MKKLLFAVCFMAFVLSMSSCFVNRHVVGDGPIGKADTKIYSHGRQFSLFWGLINLGRSKATGPEKCGYQIKSAFNGVDIFISTITGGIIGSRVVKIYVKHDSDCTKQMERLEHKAKVSDLKNKISDNK
jgi:hypothetical protein